jgi:hypothetical protein
MIENNIFTHDGIPCLDYLDERSKKVALGVNAQTVIRTSVNEGSEAIVELQPRPRVERNLTPPFAGSITKRYTDGVREASELIGQWENFIPGLSATVILTGDALNGNLAQFQLVVTSDASLPFFQVPISGTYDISGLSLRNTYSKVITFIENGHFFLIVQDFGVAKELILVDLWLFKAIYDSSTSLTSGDAPFFRFNGTTNLVINPITSQVNIVSISAFSGNVPFLNPTRAGVFDSSFVQVSTSAMSIGASAGDTVQMLAYSTQNLRTGYYYTNASLTATVTLPTGDTAVQLPDAFSSNYHLDENLCKDSAVYAPDMLVGDARMGDAVVNRGFVASTVYTGVDEPRTPDTPVTATNNNYLSGFNFLQWVQTKGANFRTTVLRRRLMPPINLRNAVIEFSDSGAGHFRLSSVGFGTSTSDTFNYGVAKDKNSVGIVVGGDSWMNPVFGNYVGMVQVPQSQMLAYDSYNGLHAPFAKRGRVQVTDESLRRTTPLFGVDTSEIKDLFDVGNGRLAIVTKSNEITISSPVRTWNNFPSFLDFQVLVGVNPSLTAERYKLTSRNITSITAYQAGYLVSTTEGLFSINNITGIISKVNSDNCLSCILSAGIYITLNQDSTYAVYQYDDNVKQVVEVMRGNIHPVLMSTIGNDYKRINTNNYSYYVSRKNTVIARGSNNIYFLDENNVLHVHNFAVVNLSYCGKLLSCMTTNSDSIYGRTVPFLCMLALSPTPGNMTDVLLNSLATLNFNNVVAHIYTLGFSRYGSVNPATMELTQVSDTLTNVTAIPYDTHLITTLSYPKGSTNINSDYVEHNQSYVEFTPSVNTPSGIIKVILNTLYFRNRFTTLNTATASFIQSMDTLILKGRLVSRLTYAKVAYWITVNTCGLSNVTSSSSPQKVNKR